MLAMWMRIRKMALESLTEEPIEGVVYDSIVALSLELYEAGCVLDHLAELVTTLCNDLG